MKTTFRLCVLMMGWALLGTASWGQQQVSGPQQPAGQPSMEQSPEAPADQSAAGPVADTRPLTGAEERTTGSRSGARNYIVPSLQLYEYADSNRHLEYTSGAHFVSATSVVGRLALQHVKRTNTLALDYMGGGQFYNNDPSLNATMHQIGLSETVQGRRWGLMLGDRGTYLPEPSFGFGGFGSFGGLGSGMGGGFGAGLGNLNPLYSPNQSILSGRGYRIGNSAIGQLTYSASARSQFTVTASYGLLRFEDATLIDSDNRVFAAGYNRMMTRHDTLGVLYGVSMFHFRGSGFGFDSHFIQLTYGRQIAGRLSLDLAAGPQVSTFKSQLSGSGQSYYWNAHASLRYRWTRSDMGLSYSRYSTAGSGLFYGAETDRLELSFDRRLTRSWSGSINPGYSHNTRLSQGTATGTKGSYDASYARAGIRRSLNRYADFNLNYSLQQQHAGSGINQANGTSLVRHVFGLGLNFHPRQIPLD